MVAAVRRGLAVREVAERFGVAPSTVFFWVRRAGAQRVDRVDWQDRPRGPRSPANKSGPEVEDLVLTLRRQLKERSVLGEFGPDAIHRALLAQGAWPIPARATIHRILVRRGALDAQPRVRRPAPPPGWYLPEVVARRAELDSFDLIEGLVIQGGTVVEVLTGTSRHGGLVGAWPDRAFTARLTAETLLVHWRQVGLPAYAQFDNDTRFQGPHQHPDTLGRVTRLCLSLGLIPVFVPPQEMGFQAAIENFNGRWQANVWPRFHHDSLAMLQSRSAAYRAAARAAARCEAAPPRQPVPVQWEFTPHGPLEGCIVFLRRTSERGTASLLGHTFPVDPHWPHRLVRAEVDLTTHVIRFYALRRRDTTWQPLLKEIPYELPRRPWRG